MAVYKYFSNLEQLRQTTFLILTLKKSDFLWNEEIANTADPAENTPAAPRSLQLVILVR